MRVSRLYARLFAVHLRALLEYESDFWIMAVATLLTQAINIVFLSAIFAKVPALNGWPYWSVVAMFGIIALSEGVGSLFFEGTWRIAEHINLGTLDYMLVRPYPIVLQVMSAEVGINGLTNIITGSIMIGVAFAHAHVPHPIVFLAAALLLLVSAVTIKLGINLATNSLSFWLSSPNPWFAMAVHQVGDLARFPIGIYPPALKVALGVVIPFAFISSFPMGFLLQIGRSPWLGLLTPLVAGYCLVVPLLIFHRGLRRYESTGN